MRARLPRRAVIKREIGPMRKILALLSTAAVVATLLPVSANAASRHHARYARVEQPVYAAEPVYASTMPDPLLYPVGGAIIGAAVCPPGATLSEVG